MKKRILTIVAAIMLAGGVSAWEFPGFEWTVGADVTSSYLWRGLNLGGLALQPDVMVGYGGLQVEAWANISPVDYTFKELAPELDLMLSYSIFGFKVGINHQYYFDGTKFFDFKIPSLEAYEAGDYGTNQTEVFAEFNLGDVLENVPLHVGWYTYISGNDYFVENNTTVKRAYSSYLDLSFEVALPHGLSITPTVGMTPWKSMYNFYTNGFSVNNASLKFNWEYEAGDHFALDVYAIGMVNTTGITKDNVWKGFKNTYSDGWDSARLNFAIGLGLWLY